MSTKHFNDLNIAFKEDSINYAKINVEPFERGYAVTIGNALRRTLLTALPGAAVTSLRFEGISHEFSTIEGVSEDVADIILNFKKIRFSMDENATTEIINLKFESDKGELLAGALDKYLTDFKVINKKENDYTICLKEGVGQKEALKEIIKDVDIFSFNKKIPTMEEIFIKAVNNA